MGAQFYFIFPGNSGLRLVYGLVKKGLVLLVYLIPQKQEKLLVSAVWNFFLLYLWQSPYNVQSPVEAAKLIGKILTKNDNNLIPWVSSWDQNYICNILQTWCHGTVLLVEIMNLKGFDNQGVRHCMIVWSWARAVQRHLCQSFFNCFCCCCCFWFCVCVTGFSFLWFNLLLLFSYDK